MKNENFVCQYFILLLLSFYVDTVVHTSTKFIPLNNKDDTGTDDDDDGLPLTDDEPSDDEVAKKGDIRVLSLMETSHNGISNCIL